MEGPRYLKLSERKKKSIAKMILADSSSFQE